MDHVLKVPVLRERRIHFRYYIEDESWAYLSVQSLVFSRVPESLTLERYF